MKTVKLIFVKIHFKNVRFIFHTALQKNLKIFFGNLKKKIIPFKYILKKLFGNIYFVTKSLSK